MLPYLNIFGIEINMYKLFFYIALASVPVVLFVLKRHFGFSNKQMLLYTILTLVFGLISAFVTASLKRAMLSYASGGTYTDTELLRNYGIPIFLPIFMFVYCLLRKDDFRKISDYIAPSVYSVMTFVKIGCTFCGCCRGEEYAHGIWNETLRCRTFPVQPLDAATSFCIFLICMILVYKMHKKHRGYIYPIGGMLFAITKGYWESFRVHDSIYERSYLNTGWTLWQYWLLLLFIGCIIWILILLRNDRKQTAIS